MTDYFLRSSRLGLRDWRAGDLDLALSLWGDEAVTRLVGGPFARPDVEARLAREIENASIYGVSYWPMFLLDGGEHVGAAGLRPYDVPNEVWELGFYVRRAAWGKGYATEAARAVMRYAFEERKAAALYAGHHPENQDSRRALAKLGFGYVGDELYAPTGLMHPGYRLSRADWLERAAR